MLAQPGGYNAAITRPYAAMILLSMVLLSVRESDDLEKMFHSGIVIGSNWDGIGAIYRLVIEQYRPCSSDACFVPVLNKYLVSF